MADDGIQARWYAADGAIGAAGGMVRPVGFINSPLSQGLEFFGPVDFVVGLMIILLSMPSLRQQRNLGAVAKDVTAS